MNEDQVDLTASYVGNFIPLSNTQIRVLEGIDSLLNNFRLFWKMSIRRDERIDSFNVETYEHDVPIEYSGNGRMLTIESKCSIEERLSLYVQSNITVIVVDANLQFQLSLEGRKEGGDVSHLRLDPFTLHPRDDGIYVLQPFTDFVGNFGDLLKRLYEKA